MKTTVPGYKSTPFSKTPKLLLTGLGCFLVCLSGCQSFPYKIDPSGDCLFVRNDQSRLPADESPFVNNPTPTGQAPPPVVLPPQTTVSPSGLTTIPGVNVIPGSADVSAPRNLGTIPAAPLVTDRSTLAIPGAGPIMLVEPQEQIALVGSEIVVLASYLGDDQYLRTGEKVEWSLDGVGHLMMTNKADCGSWMFGNFTRDKKVSDRYAVASTTLYEGVLDRGAPDQSGNIPVLAGQSWVAVQSAVEGTTTVTAMASSITDWQRRSDRAIVHWIDAEWIFPVPDLAKIGSPKPVTTTVKKRSSNAPCPGWLVRYEILGGPEAVFEHTGTTVAEVATDENGRATVNIQQRVGETGTNTFSVRIIRPAGVDNGSKRLDLGTRNVAMTWTHDDILEMNLIKPTNPMFNTPMTWVIELANFSGTQRDGWMKLDLPEWVTYLSCTPIEPRTTPASLGTGKTLIWDNLSIAGRSKLSISVTLQANGNSSEAKTLDIAPLFTPFGAVSGSQGGTTTPGAGWGTGATTGDSVGDYITPDYRDPTGPPVPPPSNTWTPNGNNNGSSVTFEPPAIPNGTPGTSVTPPGQNIMITMSAPTASVSINRPTTISAEINNFGNTNIENGVIIYEFSDGMIYCDLETGQERARGHFRQPLDRALPGRQKLPLNIPVMATQIGNHSIKISFATLRPGVSPNTATLYDYEILNAAECQIRATY